MPGVSNERLKATDMLMRFEDGSEAFCLLGGATLADISEILERIRCRHEGKLISVDVRFEGAGKCGYGGIGASHAVRQLR
jgi:hypothetical protein